MKERNSMAEEEDVDIVAVCKDILVALIDGKTPEEVQAVLTQKGISEEDAQNLMNVTIICTQEVTPVIEQRVSMEEALKQAYSSRTRGEIWRKLSPI